MVEETGVPGENHRPVASNWQTKIYFTDTGCHMITLIYWYKMSCDHKDTLIYWYRMSCDHIELLIQDVMCSHWFTDTACHVIILIYWYRMSSDHIDLLIQDVMWSHWFTVKLKLNSILDKPLIVNLSQLMWHVMCLISVIQVKVSVIRSDHYYPM